jgi:TonB family protein
VRKMLLLTLRRLTFFAVLSLFPYAGICPVIHSQQVGESKATQGTSTAFYPNNPSGLRQLLDEMLAAARQDDHTKLQALIREAEIPDYENWFTTTFGREKGESAAGSYGETLQKDQKDFQDLLIQLSQLEGEFSIQKVDTAKKYGTLTGPVDEYIADWKETGPPTGQEVQHIAEFFFIEGQFRWNNIVQFYPFQSGKPNSFVAAKLVKRVAPEYPEEARQKSIQGTVILNVILRKDGSVTVQNVAAGDPILSPAAIEAVRQWRYEPTLINGRPFEVQTKINVVFELTR